MRTRTFIPGVIAALSILPLVAPLAAQEGAFITRIGRDTLAVERFTRSGDRIEGTVLARSPRVQLRSYTATLRPDGSVSRIEMSIAPPTGAATARVMMEIPGDTAMVAIHQGDSTANLRVATPSHTVPYIPFSYALFEVATRASRAAGADSAAYAFLPLGARESFPVRVTRLGADSLIVRTFAGPLHVRADEAGSILGAQGMQSTQKIMVDRVATADIQALAADFQTRETRGAGLGPLSPRDSLEATVAGATVSVNYGRPSARGRTVIGGIVPLGAVWRTGANQATHLRTDRALRIGDLAVPAGTYTLFTIPSADAWTLIVSRKTGQWGTDYDPTQDLGRVRMPVEAPAAPVEQFTIGVDPRGEGGVLWMAWGNTRAAVGISRMD